MTTPKYESEISETIENFLYEFVMSNKGSISAEHGVGIFKRRRLRLVKTPESLELMKQLKVLVDPRNILNPYKVLPWWGTDQCQLCLNFWWSGKAYAMDFALTWPTLHFIFICISFHILYWTTSCILRIVTIFSFPWSLWDVFEMFLMIPLSLWICIFRCFVKRWVI